MVGFTDAQRPSHANNPHDSDFVEDGYPLSTLGQPSLDQNVTDGEISDASASCQNEMSIYGGGEEEEEEEEEADAEEILLTRCLNHPPSTRNVFAAPLERTFRALAEWMKGPQPPRIYTIEPVFSRLQLAPVHCLRRLTSKRTRFWLLTGFCALWTLPFLAVLSNSAFGCQVEGYGSPVRLSCTSRFWPGSSTCGINGDHCRPFQNRTFAFRCPAACRSTIISTPETIGDQQINYQSVVVGGPTYRGDSFICAAAIHAGLLDDTYGGSGVVSLIEDQRNFPSVESNGILSIGFTPGFPVAFTFPEEREPHAMKTACKDPRWRLLTISVVFSSLLSILTISPAVFFGSVFVGVYMSVALALDPPEFENYYSVISQAFGGLLPALFVGLVIYHFCISYTLRDLTAQFEKTVLWLGSCWLGALDNFTLERLPIQRLTPHDLRQPGAVPTLMVIVTFMTTIALAQGWAFRIEGRMPRYLIFYALLGLLFLTLMAIPHMNLRLHHYIIALILLPGTALQTRPSLIYQGFLVGLFINGIARWGFDSILQTPGELFKNDFDSIVPQIAAPIIEGNNITFSWVNLTSTFDSISMLVNDVERFRDYEDHSSSSLTWTRYKVDEPEFFRFGYVSYLSTGGSVVGKYSKPATWAVNSTWIQ